MDSALSEVLSIAAVLLLVFANGFFVAAEFSLVAVRRSRVTELVGEGRRNARALQHTVDRLDASLAATQLGITISSLALGWIGSPRSRISSSRCSRRSAAGRRARRTESRSRSRSS